MHIATMPKLNCKLYKNKNNVKKFMKSIIKAEVKSKPPSNTTVAIHLIVTIFMILKAYKP